MSRWYPHLDYSGEPMARGEFRDPQPTDAREVAKRDAAIRTIERFCEQHGVEVPPLTEETTAPTPNIRCVSFIATIDGRRFGIGYEMLVARGR